jgi:hypothetical protein
MDYNSIWRNHFVEHCRTPFLSATNDKQRLFINYTPVFFTLKSRNHWGKPLLGQQNLSINQAG